MNYCLQCQSHFCYHIAAQTNVASIGVGTLHTSAGIGMASTSISHGQLMEQHRRDMMTAQNTGGYSRIPEPSDLSRKKKLLLLRRST